MSGRGGIGRSPGVAGPRLRPFHAVLLLPVGGLFGTPFLPFVNAPAAWFGLPSVVVWVCAWCLITSGLLAWVLRREERAGLHRDEAAEPAGEELP